MCLPIPRITLSWYSLILELLGRMTGSYTHSGVFGGGIVSYMKKSSLDNMNLMEKFQTVTESWLHVPHFDNGDEDSHHTVKKGMPDVAFTSLDENFIVQKVLNSLEFQRIFQAQKELEGQQVELKGRFNGFKLDEDMRLKATLYDEQTEQVKHLTAELDRLKMQIDAFSNQQKRLKDSQDYSRTEFNLWQKKIRDLSARLRLHQDALYHTVKKMEECCKQQHPILTTVDIEKHVIKFLSGLFSSEEEAVKSVPEIRSWIQNLFVAKDELEARLANVSQKVSFEAANRSAEIIMTSVSDIIKEEFIRQHQDGLIGSHYTDITSHSDGDGLSYSKVQKIVDEALAKYDADKTGMVDYALESSGGSILSIRCTEIYQPKTAMLTVMGWFHWYPSALSPRTVIQPGVVPGNCWAFSGQGLLVIQLSAWIKITAFSIEHIPRSLSPAGKLDSAPRDFRVLGLKHENDNFPMEIGKYQYQENGTSLQFFKVQRLDLPPFNVVELQIETNHGNKEYTCLYRFRVHGTRVSEKDLGR